MKKEVASGKKRARPPKDKPRKQAKPPRHPQPERFDFMDSESDEGPPSRSPEVFDLVGSRLAQTAAPSRYCVLDEAQRRCKASGADSGPAGWCAFNAKKRCTWDPSTRLLAGTMQLDGHPYRVKRDPLNAWAAANPAHFLWMPKDHVAHGAAAPSKSDHVAHGTAAPSKSDNEFDVKKFMMKQLEKLPPRPKALDVPADIKKLEAAIPVNHSNEAPGMALEAIFVPVDGLPTMHEFEAVEKLYRSSAHPLPKAEARVLERSLYGKQLTTVSAAYDIYGATLRPSEYLRKDKESTLDSQKLGVTIAAELFNDPDKHLLFLGINETTLAAVAKRLGVTVRVFDLKADTVDTYGERPDGYRHIALCLRRTKGGRYATDLQCKLVPPPLDIPTTALSRLGDDRVREMVKECGECAKFAKSFFQCTQALLLVGCELERVKGKEKPFLAFHAHHVMPNKEWDQGMAVLRRPVVLVKVGLPDDQAFITAFLGGKMDGRMATEIFEALEEDFAPLATYIDGYVIDKKLILMRSKYLLDIGLKLSSRAYLEKEQRQRVERNAEVYKSSGTIIAKMPTEGAPVANTLQPRRKPK